MHLLALALLLCSSTALKADGSPAVPEDSLFRTHGGERFEVAMKGWTGAHIDVRTEVVPGRHRSLTTTTTEGNLVLMDILVRDGEDKGKRLLELKVVEFRPSGPAEVAVFTDDLAPGESNIRGDGWHHLFEISLTQK
jgi:hypothetical protein